LFLSDSRAARRPKRRGGVLALLLLVGEDSRCDRADAFGDRVELNGFALSDAETHGARQLWVRMGERECLPG
jgi:hypothetical protein